MYTSVRVHYIIILYSKVVPVRAGSEAIASFDKTLPCAIFKSLRARLDKQDYVVYYGDLVCSKKKKRTEKRVQYIIHLQILWSARA